MYVIYTGYRNGWTDSNGFFEIPYGFSSTYVRLVSFFRNIKYVGTLGN